MKPWAIATCALLVIPCGAWARQDPLRPPAPEVAWETGVRPAFIRSVGFAEDTADTPVRFRSKRPDLGPVYAWKGTPLWLVVEVERTPSRHTRLCAEWPSPTSGESPLRDCQPLPEGPGRLLFAAPDNRDWPEDRYVVELSTETADGPVALAGILGAVAFGVGDKPAAAANGGGTPKDGGGQAAPAPQQTPAFPWPPPRPTVRTVLDRGAVFADAASLGAVADRLSGALRAAGYESPAFYSAPGGYAMVARLEQIEADGTPKPVPMRWSAALPQREVFSLGDYFRALFSAPEGHYRVVVFIVSDQPFATTAAAASREQAAAWLHGGLNALPAAIADLPLDARHACTALIYQFRKHGFQGDAVSVLDGAPGASVQLQRTRILDERGRLNR